MKVRVLIHFVVWSLEQGLLRQLEKARSSTSLESYIPGDACRHWQVDELLGCVQQRLRSRRVRSYGHHLEAQGLPNLMRMNDIGYRR